MGVPNRGPPACRPRGRPVTGGQIRLDTFFLAKAMWMVEDVPHSIAVVIFCMLYKGKGKSTEIWSHCASIRAPAHIQPDRFWLHRRRQFLASRHSLRVSGGASPQNIQ